MAVVQLFTRRADDVQAFDVLNEDHRQANQDSIRISSTFPPLISLTRAATTGRPRSSPAATG